MSGSPPALPAHRSRCSAFRAAARHTVLLSGLSETARATYPPCLPSIAACAPLPDYRFPQRTPVRPALAAPKALDSAPDAPTIPVARALARLWSAAAWVGQCASKISLNLRRIPARLRLLISGTGD